LAGGSGDSAERRTLNANYSAALFRDAATVKIQSRLRPWSLDFPVQQTASLSGTCAVVGRNFFLKNSPRRQFFHEKASARLLHTFAQNELEPSHTSGNRAD
jgi:hypothetical protein